MRLLRPAKPKGTIDEADLIAAEHNAFPLCDEGHLQVFEIWYNFGGMKRPLTPVEAAEMPATLAQDFIYLLNRMRHLSESELALDEWVNRSLHRDAEQHEALYPPKDAWG